MGSRREGGGVVRVGGRPPPPRNFTIRGGGLFTIFLLMGALFSLWGPFVGAFLLLMASLSYGGSFSPSMGFFSLFGGLFLVFWSLWLWKVCFVLAPPPSPRPQTKISAGAHADTDSDTVE